MVVEGSLGDAIVELHSLLAQLKEGVLYCIVFRRVDFSQGLSSKEFVGGGGCERPKSYSLWGIETVWLTFRFRRGTCTALALFIKESHKSESVKEMERCRESSFYELTPLSP